MVQGVNKMESDIKEKLILALDVDTINQAEKYVKLLRKYFGIFKIGPVLFLKYGPEIINLILKHKRKVFLDLKLHDIPNTVKKSIENALKRDIYIIDVHISGGRKMLESAREAVASANRSKKNKSILIGITVLTSLTDEEIKGELNIKYNVKKQAEHLALLAKKCRLDGVVASAWEIKAIKKACGRGFKVIAPGIRLDDKKTDDQSRIATPSFAIKEGADFLVIGRAVTGAKNPVEVCKKIHEELIKE